MPARSLYFSALVCVACASGPELRPETWRARLRDALSEPVPTRERRDELSRVLVDAVDSGAFDRLTRPEVQAALGAGLACESYELCARQGFEGSDWYYLVGHATDERITQLPVLIVGFDPHDRVKRVYTLRTH
jgi:hypothetical protein